MRILRKLAALTLVLVMVVSAIPLSGLSAPPIRVTVDGLPLAMDVSPVVIDGRTLVPLRAIFEALGATVSWNETSQTVVGTRANTQITLRLGSRLAQVDGREVTLDITPLVLQGRVMVPVRFVAESLGAIVYWNESTRTVEVARRVPVEAVRLSADAVTLLTTDPAVQLSAVVLPPNANDQRVRWTVGDTSVATVSSTGLVTPVGPGKTQVTVASVDGARTAVCEVLVAVPVIKASSIELNHAELVLKVGDTEALTATIKPSNATNQAVVWTSSNPAVAQVDSKGQVVAVATGQADVTVRLLEGKLSADVRVIVTGPRQSFPPQFDLRTARRLTPVNAQGRLGTCWAIALIDALESHPIGNAGNLEFSVYDMAVQTSNVYSPSFARHHNDGGMSEVGLAYLASWRGPVLESEVPYTDEPGPPRLTLNVSPAVFVQGATLFPNRRNALDNDLFKQHLMRHGAIYASKWKGTPSTFGEFYNQDTFAWYYPHAHLTPEGNGHAITIVGWDDDFPKERFNPANRPPGNGAFIARNTKGPTWGSLDGRPGMGGYFYISYYDTKLGQTMFGYPNETGALGFTRVDPVGTYDFIYQHDTLGYNDRFTSSTGSVSMRNDFVVGQGHNERLSAVSFYTLEQNVSYEIWIYRQVSGPNAYQSKHMVSSGLMFLPGYHTIDLESEIRLVYLERIGVEVRLSSRRSLSFAIDSSAGYLSKTSEARPGVSFTKKDGSWVDLHALTNNGKACIKIFTRDSGLSAEFMMSPDQMQRELDAFVNNISAKQAEFIGGFAPAERGVIDQVYVDIRAPLSILEFEMRLNRILAMAGDHHSDARIPTAHSLNRGGVAVEFVWLGCGLYATNDSGAIRRGDRIVQVGHLDVGGLMVAMRSIVPTENDYWIRYGVNQLLRREAYLREYGIINHNNTVDMLLERDGIQFVTQVPLLPNFIASLGSRFNELEYRIERENNLGYLKFNSWPNDKESGREHFLVLKEAIHNFFAEVRNANVANIVVDVRDNPGGFVFIQNLLGAYTIQGGLPFTGPESMMRDAANFFSGKFYYLQGYGSASLSVNAATVFKERSRIIVVGEESGQRPNFNHGATFNNFVGLPGRYRLGATTPPLRSFQKPGDDTIHPDIPIVRTLSDVLSGRDIQLERLREITRKGPYVYTSGAIDATHGAEIELIQGTTLALTDRWTLTVPFDPLAIPTQSVWFECTEKRIQTKATLSTKGGKIAVIVDEALAPGTYHLMVSNDGKIYAVLVTVTWEAQVTEESGASILVVTSSSGTRLTPWNYYTVSFDRHISPRVDASKVRLLDSEGRERQIRVERPAMEPGTLLIAVVGKLPPGSYNIIIEAGAVQCAIDESRKNAGLTFRFSVME